MGSAFNKDLLHQTSFVSILARRQNHWNNIDICKASLVSVDQALAEVLRGEGNGTHSSPLAWNAVHGVARHQTRLSNFTFTFHFHAMEKEMATHSTVLTWRISGTGEPGRLQSMGLLGVRHEWVTSLSRIGEGNGNPLQCSYLENPRDRGAWWAAVSGVTQSQTQLKWRSSSSSSRRAKRLQQVPTEHLSLWVLNDGCHLLRISVISDGKEYACNAGDLGSIPGLGRSLREEKAYPLQYSGLEDSMDCI